MGITSPLDSLPAEAIGGLRVGVTPLEMASAYGTLAAGGIHHAPTAVSRVEFPGGKVEQTNPDSGNRVLTEGQAYDVTKLLEGVITQGTGAGYTSIGCTGEAGKTGTSEGESDAWFVGYTPLFATAVWVGHPESRDPTGFGGPTAGPIWQVVHVGGPRRQLPGLPGPDRHPDPARAAQQQHPFGLAGAFDQPDRAERRHGRLPEAGLPPGTDHSLGAQHRRPTRSSAVGGRRGDPGRWRLPALGA